MMLLTNDTVACISFKGILQGINLQTRISKQFSYNDYAKEPPDPANPGGRYPLYC